MPVTLPRPCYYFQCSGPEADPASCDLWVTQLVQKGCVLQKIRSTNNVPSRLAY